MSILGFLGFVIDRVVPPRLTYISFWGIHVWSRRQDLPPVARVGKPAQADQAPHVPEGRRPARLEARKRPVRNWRRT